MDVHHGENTLNVSQESENPPEYGIRLFLFNDVPRGAFLAIVSIEREVILSPDTAMTLVLRDGADKKNG